jgi:hypothetical protein
MNEFVNALPNRSVGPRQTADHSNAPTKYALLR